MTTSPASCIASRFLRHRPLARRQLLQGPVRLHAAPRASSAPPAAAVAASPSPPPPAAATPSARRRASDLATLAAIFAYGASSLSGVFVNKACLSAYAFPHALSLMLSQLVVSVSAFTLLRALRVVKIPARPLRDIALLLFPALFLIANVTIGLIALRLVNIPMFSAFRRLSVLNVLLLEYLILHKTASRRILSTVVIMVLGSFLAGLGDVTFDPVGYALVFLNNFVTAANLVAIKKTSAIVRLDALALAYYISLIALPIVFLLAAGSGDLSAALAAIAARQDLHTPGFALALSLSAASAFLVNFFTNLCTQLTSPLTTAITGQMKNVLQTVLGIFAWGYKVTALNLSGLGVALAGSLLFAFYKYEEAMAQRDAPAASHKIIAEHTDILLDDDRSPKGHPVDENYALPNLATLRTAPGDSAVFLSLPTNDESISTHVPRPARRPA